MNQTLPHILIAEGEFLIGLDAEYLLKSAFECRTSLVRPEQIDEWSSTALAGVDLCLLDVPLDPAKVLPRIRRLIEEDVPLVLSTVSEVHRSGLEGHDDIPIVMKPYDGETLAAIVRSRLRPQAQPDA